MKHFAEKLKSARLMNGLSLQALADKIKNKVSKQALSKYELGKVIPDSEMIQTLSEALKVRPDYFYSDINIEFGEIEFRKLKKYPVKEKRKIVEIAKDTIRRYIELEDVLGLEYQFENPVKNLEIKSYRDVEKAAEQCREKWKLGSDPISNVIELLEDNHVKVIELPSTTGFDGFSAMINNKIPLIVLNINISEVALDRKRFTALHELGHLILNISGLDEKQKEKYCHYFASAMLIPEETLKMEIGNKRSRLSIKELSAIKMQYGISIQALAYRAKNLGIISENYLNQFFFMFNQLGFKILEPVAYEGYETSNRFSQLLFRALAEEIISLSKAAALSNKSLAEFRQENFVI